MERWIEERQDLVWRGDSVLDLETAWDKKKGQKTKMKLASSLIIGDSVLDIGCGTGDLYSYLENVDYLGVDQSSDMLERARERNPSAKFIEQNIYDLDLPPSDTVVCPASSPLNQRKLLAAFLR